MTYPYWNGIQPAVQVEQVHSPIITGIGVYGLTHDYGDVEDEVTIDFTLGHFQKITVSEVPRIYIPNPPGAVEIILQVTQTGAGGFVPVWDGSVPHSCAGADTSALITPAATNPAAVDLIRMQYNGIGWYLSSLMLDAQIV
jgi:hypothetical protein